MHTIKHSGFTLIEILISIATSAIILTVLIHTYLSSLYCFQLQHSLMTIQTNGARITHLLQTNDVSEFRIDKTHRSYPNGMPIYSLYHQNKEVIAGVKALHYESTPTAVHVEVLLTEPPIEKKWYVYAPIQ